jgi:predicted glycosyltransferase
MNGSVFFYVQHLLGIGHLVRASRIAHALAEGGHAVVMAAGGVPFPGFPGPMIPTVALPPLKSSPGFAGLLDAEGKPADEETKRRRRDELLAGFDRSEADILLVEAFPFGRRQMRFELLPLLEKAKNRARQPLIACSVRDILQKGRKPERLEESVKLVEDYFDLVLVHGDPNFMRLNDSFPLADRLAVKIAYTGLVAGPPPSASSESFDVIVSAGGGAAGAELIRCAIEAAARLSPLLRWLIIWGPNFPKTDPDLLRRQAAANLRMEAFRPDFGDLLAAAGLSVSQAGYNTVCDILRANCRALFIPFAEGGESEQTMRSMKLREMGLAEVLSEDQLTPDDLARAIETSLERGRPRPHNLDLEGACGTREILRRHIPKD